MLEFVERIFGELVKHFLVMYDGASDQLGKESNEQAILEKIVFASFAAVDIHQISDLLKRKK